VIRRRVARPLLRARANGPAPSTAPAPKPAESELRRGAGVWHRGCPGAEERDEEQLARGRLGLAQAIRGDGQPQLGVGRLGGTAPASRAQGELAGLAPGLHGGREVLTRQGLVHGGQRGEPGRVTRVCRAATGDGDARHGALRAAEGFARLGDRDAAVLALRIAETAAARHGDGEDSARVRLAGERMLRAPADLARPAQPGS